VVSDVAADTMRRAVLASTVAGALTGAGDTLLTLTSNPDFGVAAFRLAYTVGPIVIGAVCGALVSLPIAVLWRGRARSGAAVAAVGLVWATGLLRDAGGTGVGGLGLAVLAVLVLGAAAGLGRVALDIVAAVDGAGPRGRRWLAAAGAVGALAGIAALAAAWQSAFGGGTGPCAAASRTNATRPNVILVSVDALRADTAQGMRSYQRLAARGVEFANHMTSSPWTLPSVASLLTGLPPADHGAGQSRSWRLLVAKSALPPAILTLAGRLGAEGYRTHAIVTNPFLTRHYGMDQGFCSFENVSMEGETARAFAHTLPLRAVRAVAPGLLPSDRARMIRERAEEWLAEHAGAPFFLWLHFLDPHAPYGDRDGASTSLALDLMAFQHREELVAPFGAVGRLRAGEYRPGPAERDRIAALYREDVDYVDGEIGRLLDTFEERGLSDRTAIVLTADHGEEFWEHGGVEHGRTLFEEVMRVPLVVVPPGGREAPMRSGLTSVIDVAPTIFSLAGVKTDGLPGIDLFNAPASPDRVLELGNLLFGEEWVGVRTSRLKYARGEHGEERLFDLIVDPEERVNRAAVRSVDLASAREVLARALRSSASGRSYSHGVRRLRHRRQVPTPAPTPSW
jgi:arylsulfatase